MKHQRGQSMTEFAIGLSAMTLLLLGMITIGGYQQVQRRILMASREAAFEMAWTGANAETPRRIAEQHLDDPALVDAVGSGPYVRPADISATAMRQSVPGLAGTAATAMVQPLRVVGGFLGGNFDLSTDGMLVGEINVNVAGNARLPAPFDALSLPLREQFSLVTDAWNAAGATHVRDRASGLVPTTRLAGLQALWRPLLAPLSLIEPSLARLCFGLIEPERIPEDRLGSGSTALPGRCP